MTNDQAILLAATNVACAMLTDDDQKKGRDATVDTMAEYLDIAVPALIKRATDYSKMYGLDLTASSVAGKPGEKPDLQGLAKTIIAGVAGLVKP